MRNGLTMYIVTVEDHRRLITAKDEDEAAMKAMDRWGIFPDQVDIAPYNMSDDGK